MSKSETFLEKYGDWENVNFGIGGSGGAYIGIIFHIIISLGIGLSILRGKFDEYPKSFLSFLSLFVALFIYLIIDTEKKFPFKYQVVIIGLTFSFLYLVYFLERLFYLDQFGISFNEMYLKLTAFFEGSDLTFSRVLKMVIFVLLILGFTALTALSAFSDIETTSKKTINIIIFFLLFIGGVLASVKAIDKLREYKYGTLFYEYFNEKPGRVWGIFSFITLSGVIPLCYHFDKKIDKKYEEDLEKCTEPQIYEDGSVRNDTKEEYNECKKKAKDAYEKEISLKGYPLMSLIIFLLVGLIVIKRKSIFESLKKDHFRNLIISFAILITTLFTIFTLNSEKYYTTSKSVDRTKTEPYISDDNYYILTIVFLILGFLSLFSLITLFYNVDDAERPNYNNVYDSLIWLLKKMGNYSKFVLLFLFLTLSFSFLIFSLVKTRNFLTGINNLLYMVVGLTLITVIYKFLITKEFFKRYDIFRILLNILFLIPCILFFIVEYIYKDLSETPKIVYAVLLGQLMLVSSYVLIPLLIKFLTSYYVPKSSVNVVGLKKKTLDVEISKMQENIDLLKQQIPELNEDEWKEIINNQHYVSKKKIRDYLDSTKFNELTIRDAKKEEKADEKLDKIIKEKYSIVLNTYNVGQSIKYIKSVEPEEGDDSGTPTKEEHTGRIIEIIKSGEIYKVKENGGSDEYNVNVSEIITNRNTELKSENRYEQIVNYIYYYASTNKETSGTNVENINIEKAKDKKYIFELEKKEWKIKKKKVY